MTSLSLITFLSLLSYGQQIYGLRQSSPKAVVVLIGESVNGIMNLT
jgi:hypothetical protein